MAVRGFEVFIAAKMNEKATKTLRADGIVG
jgi:hypothetical protein